VTDDPRFTRIPGTRQYVLAGDTRHAPQALALGRIDVDPEFAALPEVQALGPGDVVLDVGAFVGDTAVVFLDRGCEVIAIEPYRDAYECMVRNLTPYRLARPFYGAAGDGRALAATGRFGEPGNFGARMLEEIRGAAPSVRIDVLDFSRLDFCKIDVEGCEPMVLDGMRETIRRCRPLLLIEAYDDLLAAHGFTRPDVLARLSALGYRWRVAIGDAAEPRCDYLAAPRTT
jgi:FkbM family methyltransferase